MYSFSGPREGCVTQIEADSLSEATDLHQATILLDQWLDLEEETRDFLEEQDRNPNFSYTTLLTEFIGGRAEVICE